LGDKNRQDQAMVHSHRQPTSANMAIPYILNIL
jgi:hypothetical protein